MRLARRDDEIVGLSCCNIHHMASTYSLGIAPVRPGVQVAEKEFVLFALENAGEARVILRVTNVPSAAGSRG